MEDADLLKRVRHGFARYQVPRTKVFSKYIVSRYNVLTMSTRNLTVKQLLSLAEFRYQVRRFLHFSERECRARGLQIQHYQLLIAILGLPLSKKPTVGVLAERMQ